MGKILIVDDEPVLVETIEYNLRKAGYETVVAADGESALLRVKEEHPDLVVLDLMLPKISGWEVCYTLRKDPSYRSLATPILMLTARSEEADKERGLEIGADDYLVKPFGMRELIARVRALLRRSTSKTIKENNPILQQGNVILDPGRHEVRLQSNGKQQEIKLSLKEFQLLHVLMSHPGKAIPRETLLYRVWGDDFFGDERTLDVHIRWLREKIESSPSQPEHILTVRGVGYKFIEKP